MKSLKEQINESILGGILFAVAAVAVAGMGTAFVKDIQYSIMKNMDKRRQVKEFEKQFSKEELVDIVDNIQKNPELRNWTTWNDFVRMINTEKRFKTITDKAKEIWDDRRSRLLPMEIQDGIQNIAFAA